MRILKEDQILMLWLISNLSCEKLQRSHAIHVNHKKYSFFFLPDISKNLYELNAES